MFKFTQTPEWSRMMTDKEANYDISVGQRWYDYTAACEAVGIDTTWDPNKETQVEMNDRMAKEFFAAAKSCDGVLPQAHIQAIRKLLADLASYSDKPDSRKPFYEGLLGLDDINLTRLAWPVFQYLWE